MSLITRPITANKRSDALAPPPKDELLKALGLKSIQVEWLAGDGSDRCYYRLHSPELSSSLVLMQLSEADANKLREDGYDWLKIAILLKEHGLRVPSPVNTMRDHAALIIEDYGDLMLESVIRELWRDKKYSAIEAYYERCFTILASMIGIEAQPQQVWTTRSFDVEKYSWELRFFAREYLGAALKIDFTPKEEEAFLCDIEKLSHFLAPYSRYFCHRDFHSRNIMVKGNELAIIDFQDARLGALAYDLVSLVYDNYVDFDIKFRRNLLELGTHTLIEKVGVDKKNDLLTPLKTCVLQRQLKAIGTYGFLTINKKRGNYLQYVDLALTSLEKDFISDQRWSFISVDLIERMRLALKKP